MRNKIFKIVISIIFIMIISIGTASWILSGINRNSNYINHTEFDNEMVDVNVHYRTQASEISTTTEYFIPKTFTISHNLSYTDANGNQSYDEINDAGITISNKDPLLVYYDVNNNVYKKIDQRQETAGPEQITSFSANVTEWEQVDSATTFGNVWDITVPHPTKSNYRLRFTQDSGNELTGGHGFKYTIGDVYKDEVLVFSSTDQIDNNIVTTNIYQRIIVDNQEKIRYGKKSYIFNYSKWIYYTTFQQRMIRITQTNPEPTDHEDDIKTVRVKKNSLIGAIDLGIQNHTNYGYYSDNTYNSYFDFSSPITENTDIYLRYIQGSDAISETINSTASGGVVNLYDQYLGGSNGSIDVSTLASYHNPTNSVFSNSFTINSGAKLNLTYGFGESYITPNEGTVPKTDIAAHRTTSDDALALNYNGSTYIGDENKSCHLILNGDSIIKGTMVVGAEIGAFSNSIKYSFIIGKYGILDLHGHTLTIDGGNLIAYGLVKDSIGGGKIVVKNNGSITSTLTISDGRGRDATALGTAKRQAPFSEYRLSYLQVPVYFYNGTSLYGYLKGDFADMGVVNLSVPFLGGTFNSYLFSWANSNSDEYVYFKPYQIEQLSSNKDTIEYREMYNWRNSFTFNASVKQASSLVLSASVDSPLGTININIDFSRIDVPISPFFDFILSKGYEMDIYSKLIFYPGSYFYVEQGATLNIKNTGQKTYTEVKASAMGMGITIPGETRYIAGGLMSYTNRIKDLASLGHPSCYFNFGVYNSTSYWNYVKESHIIIDGNLTFESTIDTTKNDGFYYLSGNICLSPSALSSIIENRNYIKTYDFKSELKTIFLYNSDNYSVDKQYAFATSYNLNPIISGNTSYIIDKNYLLSGKYNKSTGVFTDNATSKNYILKTDNDMYEDGSAGSNQSSRIDRNIEIIEINKTFSDYKIVIDKNNNGYLYFCGLFVPVLSTLPETISFVNNSEINVNARKFLSNQSAPLNINIKQLTNSDGTSITSDPVAKNIAPCFSNITLRYNSSLKSWYFYCYGDYPKSGTGITYSY